MARQARYQPVAVAKREYKFWITLLSALISSAPLISLIQKLFKIGLTPILSEALTYYRKIVYPLVEGLQYVLSYVPWIDLYTLVYSRVISHDAYKDLTALSFMSAMAASRVVTHKVVAHEGLKSAADFVAVGVVLAVITSVAFVFAFTLLALVFPVIAIYKVIRTRDLDPEFYVTYLTSLAIAVVAAVVFFVTNELLK